MDEQDELYMAVTLLEDERQATYDAHPPASPGR